MNLDQFNPHPAGIILFNAHLKRTSSRLKTIFILVFVCLFGTAMAQHRSHEALTYGGGSSGGGANFESGYAISLGVGYNVPLDYLKDIYKPAITYNLGVMRFMGKFTVGLNLGYHAYKPKDDLYTDEGTNITLPKFKVYSGYASVVYNVDLADGARLYGGTNIGGYYTYNVEPYVTEDGELGFVGYHAKNFYVAPKLGAIFALTDRIGLSLESTYNLFTPIEKSKYKTSSGTFYASVAGQAAVIYKF